MDAQATAAEQQGKSLSRGCRDEVISVLQDRQGKDNAGRDAQPVGRDDERRCVTESDEDGRGRARGDAYDEDKGDHSELEDRTEDFVIHENAHFRPPPNPEPQDPTSVF